MARFLARALIVLSFTLSSRLSFGGAGAVPRYPQRVLLSAGELEGLVREMLAEPFHDERLAVLERSARAHWFITDQVAVLVPLLERREDRLRALGLVVPWLLDRERASRLLALYPDDRDRAAEILGVRP